MPVTTGSVSPVRAGAQVLPADCVEKISPPDGATHALPSLSKIGDRAIAFIQPRSGPSARGTGLLAAREEPNATEEGTFCGTQASAGNKRIRLAAGRASRRGPCKAENYRLIRQEAQMRHKIAIVGAGNVGGTTAQRIAERNYADIVLLDIPQAEGLAQGKALDIQESGPVLGYDTKLTGSSDHSALEGCDLVVVTAGSPRKPGMSRDDLLLTNQGVMNEWGGAIKRYASNSIVIVVTNPLDAMAQALLQATGLSRERVIGMAGVLDSARFRTFIAEKLDVSVKDVTAFVLGGHGDDMVPLARYSTVAGIPLPDLLSEDEIRELTKRTARGGAEIVNLLKTGSAYYAPSASVLSMVDAIILDQKRILPCSVCLQGEYGHRGVFLGVPAKLGSHGAEEIIEIELTEEEKQALDRSAASVRELLGIMKLPGLTGS
jgi:malate dehydrogenase